MNAWIEQMHCSGDSAEQRLLNFVASLIIDVARTHPRVIEHDVAQAHRNRLEQITHVQVRDDCVIDFEQQSGTIPFPLHLLLSEPRLRKVLRVVDGDCVVAFALVSAVTGCCSRTTGSSGFASG